ncbi:E3 ubiquitin-protein ligase RNF123-like [Gigantopelta aegis]|uniref:E3 ubiquitin-protein ligase RNF123-like n=1 Tax=Gigantopelta aegis TaxID=1735272 RepID=UPI001B88BB19|nr:E3 ubiquitin-protein ligase RNF123-like [Gigantopelta aegis]
MSEGKKSRGFSQVVSRRDEHERDLYHIQDPYTTSLLQHVFSEREMAAEASASGAEKALGLHNLQSHIEKSLEEVSTQHQACSDNQTSTDMGRIGPSEVVFDILSNVGTLIVEPDRLGLSSHSNFSTMRANSCVFKGKWIYELMLGSKGVMQLGWCTLHCKFSQEEGVGDTPDSYAYDGSRLRKWNVKTQKYGEPWLTGDVISCAIDCDNGTITFYRNGNNMGEAFSSVKLGPNCAYFPAVSLSVTENLRANFGSTPLRYPVEGYHPLQDPPKLDLVKAQLLFNYLEKLLPVMIEDDKVDGAEFIAGKAEDLLPPLTEHRTRRCTAMLVAAHIFENLGPLLKSAYVVEACLLKFLLKICDCDQQLDEPYIAKILDILWALLQDYELKLCLEYLAIILLSSYRFSPVTPDFRHPKQYLTLTLAILKHPQTRRHLLVYVLYPFMCTFDKIKFPIFMHIKPPDDAGLAEIIPSVWWEPVSKDDEEVVPEIPLTTEEKLRQKTYAAACDKLRKKIEEIEEIQVEMLKVLLIHNDPKDEKTSRDIFMEKLHSFLHENSGVMRVYQVNTCPLPVSLCFFHRLIKAVQYYWNVFQNEDPTRFVKSTDAFLPMQQFWTDSREYFDFQRCGGLMSHLNRTLGAEVNKAQGISLSDDGKVVKMDKKGAKDHSSEKTEYPDREMPSGNTLMRLLDSLVLLYHIAAHKQLGKMCALRDNLKEFVLAYQDTEEKLKRCPADMVEVHDYLGNAKQVFLDKITEQARQMGWVIAVIYSKTKQTDIAWLLRVVLKTIQKASKYGRLFQYLPEFYIESCINCYIALRYYMHPTMRFEAIDGYDDILLKRYAEFLISHFADSRIVSNDLRDNLVQALACFTCYPQTLKVLESLSLDSQSSVLRSLIAPYENRSWAHTNWILVRLWKGCGFAFRYRYLPNLVPSKVQPTEFSFVSLQKPCPSLKFQSLLAKILLDDEPASTRFLDTLMNQLNWSFSEFVGIMQEIQQLVSKTEHLFLEGRQLKICAACFEISVCLMRVLEMVATIAPQLFTDWTRPSAELFLKRIMQLLSQVLSRITTKGGAFESLVSLPIPGLDSVTYFPVLTVALGILNQLINKPVGSNKEKATKALLTDTGFQLSTLEFVLGRIPPTKPKEKSFSLSNFEEVSAEEVEDVENMLVYLQKKQTDLDQQQQSDVSEDDLCTICYASQQAAVFVPCGHQSCKTCITQQLMGKKECFFCKSVITSIKDLKGKQILREQCQISTKQ